MVLLLYCYFFNVGLELVVKHFHIEVLLLLQQL